VAILAGGPLPVAVRLGVAMTALQFAIGTLNDIVDAPADAGRVPAKPIPSGILTTGEARVVGTLAAVAGLGLAASAGSAVLVVATLVLVVGGAYDLWAKGTAWSWLPFAVGIPLLPVFGWFGATGGLPDFFVALLPMAILAGTALSIANANADVELDLAAGRSSVATWLGPATAWRVQALAWAVVVTIAIGWLIRAERPAAAIATVAAAAGVLAVVVWLGRGGSPERRRRAWEIEAVAVATALVAWLGAVLT
jgi:4-hydroxybenzoate polyprenyltransferase